MTRSSAVGLLLVLLLSGCMGSGKPSAASDDNPSVGAEPLNPPAARQGPSTLSFNASELEFAASLARFEVIVSQDSTIIAALDVALTQYGWEEDCIAVAVSAPDADPVTSPGREGPHPPGSAIVAYKIPDDWDHPRIRAGSTELDENIVGGPVGGNEGMMQRADDELRLTLRAGQRLIVEIGGSSRAALGTGSAGVFIQSSGSLTSRPLPDAEIRCGSTWFPTGAATSHVEGPARLGAVVVGASVSLETESASTAVLRYDTAGLIYGSGRLDFVDKNVPFGRSQDLSTFNENGNILEASDEAGRISFTVDHWSTMYAGYLGWLLVDAYWPVVELLTPLAIE